MSSGLVPVVEIFGPTIQGEGPLIGSQCHFIRFGGCDFKCGWNEDTQSWGGFVCDSLHAVLPLEVRKAERLDAHTIISRTRLLRGNPGWVVLSGGNPLLHELDEVVSGLHSKGFKVSVETQGTLYKPWLVTVDQIVISPKPPSSHMEYRIKDLVTFLDHIRDDREGDFTRWSRVAIKIPILNSGDIDFARDVARAVSLPIYLSVTNVHNMYPLNGSPTSHVDTREDLLERYRWIHARISEDPVLSRVSLLPQLHVLVWGNDRGR